MEMDDKINAAGFAEASRDEDRNRIVRIMFRGIVELILVFVALGALRMRKRCAGQVHQEQFALRRIKLRQSCSLVGEDHRQPGRGKQEHSFHALLDNVAGPARVANDEIDGVLTICQGFEFLAATLTRPGSVESWLST